jgi:hypothetical protein
VEPTIRSPLATTAAADFSLRSAHLGRASPFQARGEISPHKNGGLRRTTAGSTPPPLGRRSFAVIGPLAPVGNASHPVSVRRLATSLPASFSAPLAVGTLRFASVPATRFREDSHLLTTAHVGRTKKTGPAFPPSPFVVTFGTTEEESAVIDIQSLAAPAQSSTAEA